MNLRSPDKDSTVKLTNSYEQLLNLRNFNPLILWDFRKREIIHLFCEDRSHSQDRHRLIQIEIIARLYLCTGRNLYTTRFPTKFPKQISVEIRKESYFKTTISTVIRVTFISQNKILLINLNQSVSAYSKGVEWRSWLPDSLTKWGASKRNLLIGFSIML